MTGSFDRVLGQLGAGLTDMGNETNLIQRFAGCLKLVKDAIAELKEELRNYSFTGKEEEIIYFRDLAPKVYSQILGGGRGDSPGGFDGTLNMFADQLNSPSLRPSPNKERKQCAAITRQRRQPSKHRFPLFIPQVSPFGCQFAPEIQWDL